VVKIPGVRGTVTQADDEQTVLWEYWHTIKTKTGIRREPGCNLELVPEAVTNSDKRVTGFRDVHFHGDNARMNVNSTDNSSNVVNQSHAFFVQMREAAQNIETEQERADILARIEELEQSKGKSGFLQAYQKFMSIAAVHMTVFAPFVPALTEMLSHFPK